MCSSCLVRTPKLQLTTEQSTTEECRIPTKKIPNIQGQRRSPNKIAGREKLCLASNSIPARNAQRAQTKPCALQDPETPQETESDWPLTAWVLAKEAWVSSGLMQGQGSGCSRPGRCSMWHQSSWRRSPSAPPYSHEGDNPQTGEQLYQRCCENVAKLLRHTTDFPTWGSHKGTENPQRIWLWRPVGFD